MKSTKPYRNKKINTKTNTNSLIVHQYVAALDISMQEVLPVAVGQPVEQLAHDGRVVRLREVHHLGLQQTHQIVVHVLEHEVEGAFVLGN